MYSNRKRYRGILQSVNDSRNVSQDGEEDIDEEIRVATTLKENTEWREQDGEDDLDDIAVEGCCQYVM